jgi:hypothetical protein
MGGTRKHMENRQAVFDAALFSAREQFSTSPALIFPPASVQYAWFVSKDKKSSNEIYLSVTTVNTCI